MVAGEFRASREALLGRERSDWATRRQELADLTDDWLAQLYASAGAPSGTALVAVGGYGRRELSAASDIDVVLLHEPGVDVSATAEAIWYPIWDSGVRLDHSVRTPAQARTMANSDVKVMLGLLDARTIVGDPALLTGLRSSALSDWRGRAANRLEDLRAMVALRRRHFGELAYAQEPDLKESIGGLRDVIIMRAVAASWITDVPHAKLAEPYEFLLNVRDALHQVTGRRSDILVRQEQAAVAGLLGIADPRGDGDGLLQAVAAAGRTIEWACDTVWHRVERMHRPSRMPGRRRRGKNTESVRTPLVDGAVVADGEVVLARDVRPERDPGMLLRIAAATARSGLRIAPATMQRLTETATAAPRPWSDAMRNDFVGLIGAGRGLIPVWEALDQEQLTSLLIPEWAVLRSAPQHNPVHRFTVDRHSVETAVCAATYARDVSRPDLLMVAALLHDIAKPEHGADHGRQGALMVEKIAPHMGFDAEDTATIAALVEHHLLLADVATKRDIEAAETARYVADTVGTVDRLELLWALSRADAEATGPLACSPWRLALIDALVERVAGHFSGRPDLALPTPTETELVAAAATDVVVLRDRRGGLEELVIGAAHLDPADAAALLAMHRLGVIDARIASIGGRSVSTWRVLPLFGEAPDAHRLAVDLRRILDGSLPVHQRLAEHRAHSTVGSSPAPRVESVMGAAESATVVEVRAADSPALLYRLLRALGGVGVQVTAAKVATLGADVVDVFYLVDAHGEPLSGALRTKVREVLAAAAAGA